MNAADAVAPARIPVPNNFPVTWEDPDEANLYWTIDRLHWPTPVTPVTGQYIDILIERTDAVFQAMALPVRMLSRRINTYHYHTTAPLSLSAADLEVQNCQSEAKISEVLQSLGKQWRNVYLPEIQGYLAEWKNFDLASAPLPILLVHLEETIRRIHRMSELHHLVQVPALLAPSFFLDLFNELLGSEAQAEKREQASDAYRLLQGLDNRNRAADRALWQLSRRVLASPFARQCLQLVPTDQVITTLAASTEGHDFLTELYIFLQSYGQRSNKIFELDAPTWLDDPTPVIHTLQEYITQPVRDPAAELAAQVTERERRLAETRQTLQRFPQPVIDQFESLLKVAQTGVFVGEEHNYWIDQCMTYAVRHVLLAFGRRFAHASVLEAVDDIFYLTFEEILATAADLPRLDRRYLVAGRRAELAYFRTIAPPPALGTAAPELPPDDPISRADLRFWGAPPPSENKPALLHGNGASSGVVRGRAMVVHTLAEASKMQIGDVLVVQTTQPAWTPLFAIAAAVVTDTGGILCHAAAVAREYGIPAVVGVGVATSVLRDGQIVEVNGSTGVVHVVG